jgi:hypothetical protein
MQFFLKMAAIGPPMAMRQLMARDRYAINVVAEALIATWTQSPLPQAREVVTAMTPRARSRSMTLMVIASVGAIGRLLSRLASSAHRPQRDPTSKSSSRWAREGDMAT